ncbi:MAG: ferredoxin family protein [Chloroflexi bacterium]|nr:ferredoxin family protein [Chloroflexota bacterium]
MTHVITQPCVDVKDQSCVKVCPVDCIYEGEDQFFIHPDECIDCGACVPACPVEAIFPENEVPDEMDSFKSKNWAYFA